MTPLEFGLMTISCFQLSMFFPVSYTEIQSHISFYSFRMIDKSPKLWCKSIVYSPSKVKLLVHLMNKYTRNFVNSWPYFIFSFMESGYPKHDITMQDNFY